MWWWIHPTASAATPVVAHPCMADPRYRLLEACACLVADPEGLKWWGGVGDPPKIDGTCFDVETVMGSSSFRDPRLGDALATRASHIALEHEYRLWPGIGLVSQEDKNQISLRVQRLEWDAPWYSILEPAGGEPIATLDLGGRVPWPTALRVDGDSAEGKDTADTGADADEDDVLLLFPSGEAWILLAPFAPDVTITLPKP